MTVVRKKFQQPSPSAGPFRPAGRAVGIFDGGVVFLSSSMRQGIELAASVEFDRGSGILPTIFQGAGARIP